MMGHGICHIIGGGAIKNYDFIKSLISAGPEDYIICCDQGGVHALHMSLKPDLLLGDFDSIHPGLLESYRKQNVRIMDFLPEKDFTDMELALEHAFTLAPKEIRIFGGLGSRFDHSLANAGLLLLCLEKGIKASIMDDHNLLYPVNKHIRLTKNQVPHSQFPFVSILAFSGQPTVTTKGLYYPLKGEALSPARSRGVSNYLQEETGEIWVSGGTVLVILSRD